MSYFEQMQLRDKQILRQMRINPGSGALIADETTRLVGTMFPTSGTALDGNFWTVANNGAASAAGLASAIVTLTSGTANNGYGDLVTVRKARFLFVNPNLFRIAARVPDTTEANNTRYVGAMNITAGNPPTLNNGFYFAIDGSGVLSVNTKVTGASASSVASGSFNGETGTGSNGTYTLDTNVHAYEILYFVMGAWFFIDGVLIHKFTPTTAIMSDDLNLKCFAMSLNSGSGTESADLEIWAASILRLGKELTRPQVAHISTNTTTVCKIGAGTLHRIIINAAGAGNSVTIYNNTAASGTVIGIVSPASAQPLDYDVDFDIGLTVVTSGGAASDLTVVFD